MKLEDYYAMFRTAVEEDLRAFIEQNITEEAPELREMVLYHFGWIGEGAGIKAQGKRARPIFLLLCVEAAGGNWREALPAAAAVELLHNFSLIHDDVEDRSELRRGRPTVWQKWGMNQAINAGDLVFSLAELSLLRFEEALSQPVVLSALKILQQTCIRLTHGQHLDLWYQELPEMPLELYWKMIEGKTAALISACSEMAGVYSRVSEEKRRTLAEFGLTLGLAFQVRDDWLGIWGEPLETGKSITSDLVTGKKTLPVLFGLQKNSEFAVRWKRCGVLPEEVSYLAKLLSDEGAEKYCLQKTNELTNKAIAALWEIFPKNDASQALFEFVQGLLKRKQ
jgi:geranylgeranyl diphosphate synthase type I